MQNILIYFSDPLMIVMQSLQQLGTNQEVAFVTHHDCSIWATPDCSIGG